jgi:hypothetical protein
MKKLVYLITMLGCFAARAQTASDIIFIEGKPAYVKNELLISFSPEYVKANAVNNSAINTSQLSTFITTAALNALQTSMGVNWSSLTTNRVFHLMTTADTLSIARDGDTVKVDPFWATFKLRITPEDNPYTNLVILSDSLNRKMFPVIQNAGTNVVYELHGTPNDLLYQTQQRSLHYDPTAPAYTQNAHINVLPAWTRETGNNSIRVGVYDSGIRYTHDDFGDGTLAGSNVEGGWDFYHNQDIALVPNGGSHGTACAGIIAALRNNVKGIAGIAGGSGTVSSSVKLYSMQVFPPNGTGDYTTDAITAPAIVRGATHASSTGYGFGLHVMNMSFGGSTYSWVMRSAMRTAFKNGVTIAASRGNHGNSDPNFPASYFGDWAINTTASGNDGEYKKASNGSDNYWASGFGNDVDVMAPGTVDLVTSTSNSSNSAYNTFNGASAAVPHVSGAATLLKGWARRRTDCGNCSVLYPEDVEHILEETAVDKTQGNTTTPGTYPGYDDYAGHGLIDVAAALNWISGPNFYIGHVGQNTFNNSDVMSVVKTCPNCYIHLPSNNYGVAAGNYIMDVFKVTHTFDHNIEFGTDGAILEAWPVNSRSTWWGNSNPIVPEPSVKVESYSQQTGDNRITMSGYVYWLKGNVAGQQMDKWLPTYPYTNGYPRMRASFRVQKRVTDPCPNPPCAEDPPIDEVERTTTLSPNPTTGSYTLHYTTKQAGLVMVELLNAQGTVLQTNTVQASGAGAHQAQLSAASLSSGIYFCRIITPGRVFLRKLVKQ